VKVVDDENLGPMVDALTGAMSAILLVTIFLMVNTMSSVSESVKEYGKESLYKNQEMVSDIFKREAPHLSLNDNRVYFFKSFKLNENQITLLNEEFELNRPRKLIIYSDSDESVITYNTLLFIESTVLKNYIDNLEIVYFPSLKDGLTEFFWE